MAMVDVNVNSDDWVVLADGATSMVIQLDTNGPVKIRMESAKPATNVRSGITMERNKLGQMAVHAVPSGQKVYARAQDDDAEKLVVMYA